MNTTNAALIIQVDAFLSRTGMSATRLGYLCMGDPGFVSALRNGRDPRLSTAEKLLRFMRRGRRPGLSKQRSSL